MKYRADIDGLRAVAVLLVVFYHYNLLSVPGGFLGVDVFFVISGYLITALIVAARGKQQFSILEFYERRTRRIVPALAAVLLVCTIAAPFIFLAPELVLYAKSALATIGFSSNFFFWLNAGYFAPAALSQPLLHTWSLAVEEQFYILYPLLFLLALRWFGKSAWLALLATLIVSLVLNIWMGAIMPGAAFYLAPTRAWELLLGALLVIAPLPHAKNTVLHEALALLGLCAILASGIFLTVLLPEPGWANLAACAGAALLIYTGSIKTGLVSKALSNSPLVFIGKISYSLYLWHWPLLVFYRRVVLRPPTVTESVCLLVASLILATLSWAAVERPFRGSHGIWTRRNVFAAAGIFALFMAVPAISFIALKGMPGRYAPVVQNAVAYLGHGGPNLPAAYEEKTCFRANLDAIAASCFVKMPGQRNVLIWGDSHATQFVYGLRKQMAGSGYHLVHVSVSGCAPLLGYRGMPPFCATFNRAMLPRAENAFGAVILSANWVTYRNVGEALDRTVAALQKHDVAVIIYGPSPEYEYDVPIIMAARLKSNPTSRIFPFAPLDGEATKLDQALKRRFASRKGVTYISVIDAMCQNAHCPIAAGSSPVAFDRAHLTVAGSLFAGKQLWSTTRAALDQAQLPVFSTH